jgi:diguanylate cyclase (GGDEF)-like protein/PAS domain S-box-containing protein
MRRHLIGDCTKMLGGIRTRLLGLVVATVVPFLALTGAGLWSQWRGDQAQAFKSALNEARLVADQVDDELGNLESLLAGLSQAVSTNPEDVIANDAVLRRVKPELPGYVSNILLSTLDGSNIGTSFEVAEDGRSYVGDRDFFLEALTGKRLAVGEPVRGRTTGKWVASVARRVEDRSGRLAAVMTVGIQLERFQDGLRLSELPHGSVVQILNENAIVISRSVDSASWVSRNLSGDDNVIRHMAMMEASEAVRWPDMVERITGSVTTRRVPWLVSVGLPMDIALANVESRLIWGATASAVALLLALALASTFSSRIIRPLRQLSYDASELAAGELSHRTAVRSQDEVGALATSFNAMAASLEIRHGELITAREAASTEAIKRARLEQMERQAKETLSAVIDASPVAIVCSDLERNIVVWSRAAQQIFGYSAEEALGKRTKLVPPEGMAESQSLFERCIKGDTIRDVEVKRRRKDGSLVDIRLAATPMYNPDGAVWGVAWAYDDIADRKKAEEQLRHLAHYDQLTGLPNRVALQNELNRLFRDDDQQSVAIAMFDLDGFKDVNDTDGHSTGDQLLTEVARRLTRTAGDRGRVCRLGGDEFVVVIPGCGDPLVVAELVDTMLKVLAEPFDLDGHIVHIGGSAGIAIAPRDGSNADELIANADLALYKAKSEGGHTYRVFVPVLRAQAQTRRGLQSELRRAFVENEFELFFQPLVRLADEAVVGAEALLRWRHPVRGIVNPGAFIDTLANSSLAPDVGKWILQDSCEKVAAWRSRGLVLGRMSVNLFPSQSRDLGLSAEIEDILRQTGLSADVLELEISETVALSHDDAIVPLQKLHDKGLKLAFDDFGTGYASLSYLTRFPVSRIKIDRSFVSKITDNAQDAAIVRALIAMAHNLGLGIIAEGVETNEQAKFLINEQCEEAQGFLYAKPLCAADFEAYLAGHQLAAQADGTPDKQFYRAGNVQRGAGGSALRPSNRRRPRA